jgi:hypothetical protein
MHSAEGSMQNAISRDRLRLASHVRACACGRGVILLDLRRGRYIGVSEAVSQTLAGHVDGWPAGYEPLDAHAARQDAFCGATRDLVSRGILTDQQGDPSPMVGLEEATASIDIDASSAYRAFGARRFLQFTTSFAVAAWGLRCRSLQAIAGSIAARRACLLVPEAESLQAMRSGLAAYEALRPFVFTAREKCLLDSLTLVTFLAKEGLAPRWVIGVKVGPFGAHSWVQSGNTVLNDQHEYVCQFRPILVV